MITYQVSCTVIDCKFIKIYPPARARTRHSAIARRGVPYGVHCPAGNWFLERHGLLSLRAVGVEVIRPLADRYILSEIDRLSPLKYLLSQGTLRTLQQGEGEGLCSCFRFCMSGGLGRQSLCAWHITGTAAGSADASTASSAQFFHPPCWKLC